MANNVKNAILDDRKPPDPSSNTSNKKKNKNKDFPEISEEKDPFLVQNNLFNPNTSSPSANNIRDYDDNEDDEEDMASLMEQEEEIRGIAHLKSQSCASNSSLTATVRLNTNKNLQHNHDQKSDLAKKTRRPCSTTP